MSRHRIQDPEATRSQEVPLIVYSGGRRVLVGIASVFQDGIAARFYEKMNDEFAKNIVHTITSGSVTGLSIAPTPERDPCLSDYMKERE